MSIERLLSRQAGVISRGQALAEGMSSAMIGRRTPRGSWMRLYPRVYFATDHALTAETRVRAALLWAGLDATVSGAAAAWWHGLWDNAPGPVEITIPHRRRLPAARGIQVRRRDLDPLDRVEVNGLWVTATPLTALETAVALGPNGSQLLDRALQRRITFPDLHSAYCRNLGRRDSAVAGKLLQQATDRVASEAERILAKLLCSAGLVGVLSGHKVDGYVLDFAFPENRLAIEIDGWAWHSDIERFRQDRRRQNALVLAGWTVLRFTWHDLTTRPDAIVEQIRAARGA
jgi:very-short-patch-repair endonuclease